MRFCKFISYLLFLAGSIAFTSLHAQSKVVFQFTDGFTYGKDDSLNYSGSIVIDKRSMSLFLIDKSSGKKANTPPIAITKVEHNTKEDLDFFAADNRTNVVKLNHCNEVLHIYTDDKSDWLFASENNHTYLIFHNNFVLTQFFISSGDYSLLKSLFPGR